MPIVKLQDVESSTIAALGHDPETETLAVRFKSYKGQLTSLYHYQNVSTADFVALRDAESIGKHFGQTIKADPKRWPYTKVESAPGVPAVAAA